MIKTFKEFVEEGLVSDHKAKIGERDAILDDKDKKNLGELLHFMFENGIIYSLSIHNQKDVERKVMNHPTHLGSDILLKKDLEWLDNALEKGDIKKHGSYINFAAPSKIKEVENDFTSDFDDTYDLNTSVSEWAVNGLLDILKKHKIENDYKDGEGWVSVEFSDLCADNCKLIGDIKAAIE